MSPSACRKRKAGAGVFPAMAVRTELQMLRASQRIVNLLLSVLRSTPSRWLCVQLAKSFTWMVMCRQTSLASHLYLTMAGPASHGRSTLAVKLFTCPMALGRYDDRYRGHGSERQGAPRDRYQREDRDRDRKRSRSHDPGRSSPAKSRPGHR